MVMKGNGNVFRGDFRSDDLFAIHRRIEMEKVGAAIAAMEARLRMQGELIAEFKRTLYAVVKRASGMDAGWMAEVDGGVGMRAVVALTKDEQAFVQGDAVRVKVLENGTMLLWTVAAGDGENAGAGAKEGEKPEAPPAPDGGLKVVG